MTQPLTDIQARVLAYLREFHAEQDQLPTCAVVSRAFEWRSVNAAHCHFQKLAAKGWIERNVVGGYRFTRPKTVPEATCIHQ